MGINWGRAAAILAFATAFVGVAAPSFAIEREINGTWQGSYCGNSSTTFRISTADPSRSWVSERWCNAFTCGDLDFRITAVDAANRTFTAQALQGTGFSTGGFSIRFQVSADGQSMTGAYYNHPRCSSNSLRKRSTDPGAGPLFSSTVSALPGRRTGGGAATATPATSPAPTYPAFSLNALHPTVRATAERAREIRREAEAAARRAEDGVRLAEDAAARARRSEPGYAVDHSGNGRVYEGGWIDGSWNGYGKLSFNAPHERAGESYVGQFSNGAVNGLAVANLKESDGRMMKRLGEFRTGRREGAHISRFGDGASITSFFADGKSTGPRSHISANGRRFEGEFNDQGREHGVGVEWSREGRVLRAGIWRDGALTQPLAPAPGQSSTARPATPAATLPVTTPTPRPATPAPAASPTARPATTQPRSTVAEFASYWHANDTSFRNQVDCTARIMRTPQASLSQDQKAKLAALELNTLTNFSMTVQSAHGRGVLDRAYSVRESSDVVKALMRDRARPGVLTTQRLQELDRACPSVIAAAENNARDFMAREAANALAADLRPPTFRDGPPGGAGLPTDQARSDYMLKCSSAAHGLRMAASAGPITIGGRSHSAADLMNLAINFGAVSLFRDPAFLNQRALPEGRSSQAIAGGYAFQERYGRRPAEVTSFVSYCMRLAGPDVAKINQSLEAPKGAPKTK
ncbi:MAG: hypothetical protein JNM47_17080 [Hyphomonadaceae bacterium]|nr:hypothetical protein [Hyphomonadaceae bacterium]